MFGIDLDPLQGGYPPVARPLEDIPQPVVASMAARWRPADLIGFTGRFDYGAEYDESAYAEAVTQSLIGPDGKFADTEACRAGRGRGCCQTA